MKVSGRASGPELLRELEKLESQFAHKLNSAHARNRTEIIRKWRTPAGKRESSSSDEMMTHCVEPSGGEEENQEEEKPVLTPILLY